jgi:hypothetical protein
MRALATARPHPAGGGAVQSSGSDDDELSSSAGPASVDVDDLLSVRRQS